MYELTIDWNVLKVTMDHRFYVVIPSEDDYQCTLSYDWIAAKDLEVWDLLFMQDWSYSKIDNIIYYDNIETVYNLSVENNHNYFVDKGYLVHNAKTIDKLCVDWCYNTQSECDTANWHTSWVWTTCINNCGPDIVWDCCFCAI